MSGTTLTNPNVEVEECPAGNRPVEGGGGEGMIASRNATEEVRAEWSLGNARPNPTAGGAIISYSLKSRGHVAIKLYDVAGRLIRTLVEGTQDVGSHELKWDGADDNRARSPSGVYFYRLQADNWSSERRLVVIQR